MANRIKQQYSFALDDSTIKRLEVLAKVYGTRSQALRSALAIGIEALEGLHSKPAGIPAGAK